MKKMNGLLLIISLTLVTLVMKGCVLNNGDPQTTLCQKLTAHLMTEQQVKWNKAVKASTAGEHLQVTVSFNNVDGSVTEAVCTYGLNNRDEGEDYEVDPDEFVNIPDSMVINGQDVRLQDLQTALQKVTGQAIKDTFTEENITQQADEASERVKEGVMKIKDGTEVAADQAKEVVVETAESLKKGAEQAKDLIDDAAETANKAAEQLKQTSDDIRQKAGKALENAGEKLQE